MNFRIPKSSTFAALCLLACGLILGGLPGQVRAQTEQVLPDRCVRVITANVVALDQPFFWNRLGAWQPQGQIYALRRDVVSTTGSSKLKAGEVALRRDKRARPLVLRMNVGDCLKVNFTNLLDPVRGNGSRKKQPNTRTASMHAVGLHPVNGMTDDGSNVGLGPNGQVAPDDSITYVWHADAEGTHMVRSTAAPVGGEGEGGSISTGLFGAVNVQPRKSVWFRSQVTEQELRWAQMPVIGSGHPAIDYDAIYPNSSPHAGLPLLQILDGNEIVHSDLTAIITGPESNNWHFPDGTYPPVKVYRDRNQPFREFTIIFHDEVGAVQAFPEFESKEMEHTLASVRDAFPINYGSGGIGAEILANRLGVGPMHECVTCKYEEFFLSAWTVGDPAMLVDEPANTTDSGGQLITGPKATKAFYPDDPSNVYHSYLNDHVKFRNLLAGSDDHHIFHLHAHQWLHTPNSDQSTYLDSQALGQGSGHTYEIAYDGSGNRNKTVGDSIFHCHFYPHFAQGMWAMWRVNDVLQTGTKLDDSGRPAEGSRAYPDAEIERGTPIPAVVPLPGQPMAPLATADATIVDGQVVVNGAGNPGFPFFVPGRAGQRPPRPPLDAIHDGGLPRHITFKGDITSVETRLNFEKLVDNVHAYELPENGTLYETIAMEHHAQREHPTCLPDGTCNNSIQFLYNGAKPQMGAPYADPCVNDDGVAIPGANTPVQDGGALRRYKAAAIELDVIFNKVGWHFGQQRMLALWEDVNDFLSGARAPEPFFFRARTDECIEFWHTNLIPIHYEQDDYEVRTPTDIIGQHIHLVKFDVTSSDGSANGWNYEDGTLGPEEVQHMIDEINAIGGLYEWNENGNLQDWTLQPQNLLMVEVHPDLGPGPNNEWVGAQTTVQRWFVDDVLNMTGDDRTLRTVFTHDHFGPSTHQQVGLYAGLVVEKPNSIWRDPATGVIFGSRDDGGPTSWRADIIELTGSDCLDTSPSETTDAELERCARRSFREFLLEFGDFQHAYWPNVLPKGIDSRLAGRPVNPPVCPDHLAPPCPEAVSAADPGTMVVNYRNEPTGLRVWSGNDSQQASGQAGDLSFAYASLTNRAIAALNTQPAFPPPLTPGVVAPGDPFTPLLPIYENDDVQIRVLVGAHEEEHNFTVHGTDWLFEPSDPNSGLRNSQMMGISEHFEFVIPRFPSAQTGRVADYIYKPSASVDGQWNGVWGLVRAFDGSQFENEEPAPIKLLPTNTKIAEPLAAEKTEAFNGICPGVAPSRSYKIAVVSAQQALPGGTLIYNSRTGAAGNGPLHDPTALMYVRSSDLDSRNQLLPGVPVEPLILRAAAGECIKITLENRVDHQLLDLPGASKMPDIIKHLDPTDHSVVFDFGANNVRPSENVGLHAQLVAYDVRRADGVNAGFNPVQSVSPGQSRTFMWYAGKLIYDPNSGDFEATPVEFGTIGLTSSDPIKHSNKGLVGALIIEPENATWSEDADSRASAFVETPNRQRFREHVLVVQNDINLRYAASADDFSRHGRFVPNLHVSENAAESGHPAYNYRTEPVWFRLGYAPDIDPQLVADRNDLDTAFLDATVGGRPETPIFKTKVGMPTRLRVAHPAGHAQNHSFSVHGHTWQELPWIANSTVLGDNPFSEIKGFRDGLGPTGHWNMLLEYGAGGPFGIRGEYMYRDLVPWYLSGGLWGIFKVE